MIRSAGHRLSKYDQELLYNFLDMYMADELHTVVERDSNLPNVVYKVSIPMTDSNWEKYNQVLKVFGFANGVHKMLATGAQSFDKYTYAIDENTDEEHVDAWKAILGARSGTLDAQQLAQELVHVWEGTWLTNQSRYLRTLPEDKAEKK